MKAPKPVLALLGLILIGGLGTLGYLYYEASTALTQSKTDLASATTTVGELERQVADLTANTETLQSALAEERARNEDLTDDVRGLKNTVRKLDKIVTTEPELLQKYSKVYFLNENYSPATTTPIPDASIFGPKDESIDSRVFPFLMELIEDAKDDDIEILVASGFRSFGTQAALKSSYTVRYGSGANAFSADQGYSEHQLGTTVDFTTAALGSNFNAFDRTEAFAWLEDNAYKYGFILSYPAGNSFYQYEPWHWRFVGRDLARALHRDGKNFYDLDQREIDANLGEIFE